MVAIKIPGVESIQEIAPAHDPGVRASPDAFGAGVGASMEGMGKAITSLSAHLYEKRQAAEDETAVSAWNVRAAPAIQKAQLETRQEFPDGGPGYMERLQERTQQAHEGVLQGLNEQGIRPSDRAMQHINKSFAGIQSNTLVNGVTYDNNAQVTKLRTVQQGNVDSLSSQVMSGALPIDEALKQVDGVVAASRSLYGGGELETFRKTAREGVAAAAIRFANNSNDETQARELTARFFGGLPGKDGQTGFKSTLEKRESGGKAGLVNQLGYAGLFQFGAPRLADLGVYTPGDGENLSNWSKTGKDAPGKWSGSFNIPGFPQVKTIRDFLANPEAQSAAYDAHQSEIDEASADRGLDQYIGQTVGGVPITRDGIRAMAHLGGIGGAEQFLKSGGAVNKPDPNGTRVGDYALMGARAGTAPEMPNVGKAIAFNNEIDSKAAVNRRDVASAVTDDLASMQTTGVGDSNLSEGKVAQALGPNAAEDWKTARARAKTFYDTTQDFASLPNDQIMSRLDALKPKPGQEEFVAQQALYDAGVKKAVAIQEARQTDPAGSVSVDPQVKQASQGAALDDPAKMGPLVTARLAAQTRAGIDPDSQSPITKSEALTLTAPLRKMLPGEERSTLAGMAENFKAIFGKEADTAFAYALRVHKVDAETAKIASRLVRQMGLSETTGQTAVALDKTAELSAAEKAVTAGGPPMPWAGGDDAQSFGYGQGPAKTIEPGANVPAKAIRDLRADPARAGDFDAKYGAGSAKKILDGYSLRPNAPVKVSNN